MARFTYTLFCMLFLLTVNTFAQTTISGSIKDADSGEGLTGASIIIKGTSIGTIADDKGSYRLETDLKTPLTTTSFWAYPTKVQTIVKGVFRSVSRR